MRYYIEENKNIRPATEQEIKDIESPDVVHNVVVVPPTEEMGRFLRNLSIGLKIFSHFPAYIRSTYKVPNHFGVKLLEPLPNTDDSIEALKEAGWYQLNDTYWKLNFQ
jgi:hypothetical protein